jgi:hypothetical protein
VNGAQLASKVMNGMKAAQFSRLGGPEVLDDMVGTTRGKWADVSGAASRGALASSPCRGKWPVAACSVAASDAFEEHANALDVVGEGGLTVGAV